MRSDDAVMATLDDLKVGERSLVARGISLYLSHIAKSEQVMASRLSAAQDAFFEAFASMSRWDRGELLNRLEMAIDDDTVEPSSRFQERGKANVLMNRFDDLSYAITARDGEEEEP